MLIRYSSVLTISIRLGDGSELTLNWGSGCLPYAQTSRKETSRTSELDP
jgi:hypothetical protein